MRRVLVVCALLVASLPAALAQGVATQRVCPIDGKSFTYMALTVEPSRKLNLDMKRADSFFPWPHPKCPGNGFVIYKKESDFSSSELSRLRPFVLSDEYRALTAVHSTRYLEAVLRKQLGEPPYDVAWALVQATWEVESDPVRYKQYAEEALATYDSIPIQSLTNIRFRNLKRMISGELARRLGKFDSAKDRFFEMRDSAELAKPYFQRTIEYQLRLIRNKDSRSHPLPD